MSTAVRREHPALLQQPATGRLGESNRSAIQCNGKELFPWILLCKTNCLN